MKTYQLYCLIALAVKLCMPMESAFGAEENIHEGQLALSEFFAVMAAVDETSERDASPIPENLTEPLQGSMRSLQVPFIEAAADRTETPIVNGMPPTLIVVDGHVNDDLWKDAAVSGGFWCSLENKPPTDPTEVLVARDRNYLYFAFRLYDLEPGKIKAAKTVRDTGFGYDDSITIELDTFFNRRDISEFSLNPLGTQSDEFAGGRSAKVEWKGDWQGGAVITEYGWSAEFAIPCAILNYKKGDTTFGVNFKRYQSRTKEQSYWADITPQGLTEEMGQLNGLDLTSLAAGKAWTFMPYVLAGKNISDKEGDIQDTLITGGIDIRYQPRPDMIGMLSMNPDFSQIEEAVTDISFSYSEKAVDENRPFFVEGEDYFSSKDEDNKYFYSNRAADFDFGVKSFGRAGKSKYGLLGTTAPEDRYDFAGRWLYELGETESAIATVTATDQKEFDNILAVAQLDASQSGGLQYRFDFAVTDTQGGGASEIPEGKGKYVEYALGWKWDHWNISGRIDQYDVEYFPALALLDEDLPGTRQTSASAGYYRELSGSFWHVLDSYAGVKNRETLDDQTQSEKWYAGGSIEFENQIRTTAYVEEGPYRPVTDERGVFEDYTNEDRYYSLAVDFNTRSSVFSFGSLYDWGQLGGGDYQYASVYAWLRPINEIYLNASYEITDSFGIYKQSVINGSWEITPEDSLGARCIYYESDAGDDVYFRMAYGRKARRGINVFIVYDKAPFQAEEYSLKVVYTF